MQCQNISSVVDKKTKSEIVLLGDSASNFDRCCLKSIIVSTEYRTVFCWWKIKFLFFSLDFWSDPKTGEKIQRP